MPLYIYEHPDTGERAEIIQRMKEIHKYVKDGVEWRRVFDVPQATVDNLSNIDPFSKKQFMERTAKLRGITQGDMWDVSAELSRKRAKKMGEDPVKKKAESQYKHRTGLAHPLANPATSKVSI